MTLSDSHVLTTMSPRGFSATAELLVK